jgi:hypothetical protein
VEGAKGAMGEGRGSNFFFTDMAPCESKLRFEGMTTSSPATFARLVVSDRFERPSHLAPVAAREKTGTPREPRAETRTAAAPSGLRAASRGLASAVATLVSLWRMLPRWGVRSAATERAERQRLALVEAENAALQERLERSERAEQNLLVRLAAAEAALDAKHAYFALTSREMFPPINAVLALAKTLLAAPLNAQGREVAHTLYRSGKALQACADDMAGFGRQPPRPDRSELIG